MKIKYLLVTLCAALAMTNCSQEEGVNESHQGNVQTLQAIIEGSSRSAVTDGGAFSWTTGDAISVWNGSSNNVEFTYSGNNNEFNAKGSVTSLSGYAVYPSGDHKNLSGSGLPVVNLKSSYSHGSTNAIMLAKIENGNNILSFKHLGGLMRFVVKNVPATGGSFTFTANVGITGDFQVVTENDANVINSTTATDGNKSVSINYETGTEGRTMTFYVPLPVGEYTGFKIALGGKTYETEAVNTIRRGTLLLMPTYTFDEAQLVIGEVSSSNTIKLEDGNAEATILGNAEVNVTPGDADAVATLNYTPGNNSTLAISDGSAQGAESGESKGKVIVNTTEGSTIAFCEINAPFLTVELSAAENKTVTYTEVTALTAQQTLIIGKGITVTNLKLKGGNVVIKEDATVGKIENAEGFTGKTYIVKKGTLTNSPSDNNIIVVSNESELALRVVAENGGDVTLTEDIVLNEPIVIASGKTVTLDLNGQKISMEDNVAATGNRAMLTIKGTLTIEDKSENKTGVLDYKYTAGDGVNHALNTITNLGTLILKNGKILNSSTLTNSNNFAIDSQSTSTDTSVIIEGGTVECSTFRSIRMFANSETYSNSVNIEKGEIIGQVWLQSPNNKNNKASLVIKDGSFEPKGRDGSSVYITKASSNALDVTISGGTFKTKIGSDALTGFIKGGIFTAEARNSTNTALLAEGYSFVDNTDGTYSVKHNSSVE